jgi:hypothetical protein
MRCAIHLNPAIVSGIGESSLIARASKAIRRGLSDSAEDFLGLDRGSRRPQEAVDNEISEPMHESPSGHGSMIVVKRPLVDICDDGQQQSFHPRSRGLKRRILRSASENGAEHEPKKAAVLARELNIRKARSSKGSAAPRRALHRRGEVAETGRGDGGKESVFVGEMAVGRSR